MPFGREILLRNVKYALRRVDLFHFTESDSFLFHNLRSKLFHINEVDISLIDLLKLLCYNTVKEWLLWLNQNYEIYLLTFPLR